MEESKYGREKKLFGPDLMLGKKHFLHHWLKSQKTGKQRLHRCRVAFSNGLRRDFPNFFSGVGGIISGMELHIVMETTGCYSQQLTDWINLSHPEVNVTIENARNIHAFIESLNLQHKTDKLDAQAIARFGTERQPHPTKRPSKTILTIRELSRERTALIKARVELQNRQDAITSSIVHKINAQTLATLTMQIKKTEKEIKACIVENYCRE